jgi:UDPglucose 6-dehydrogenase
MPEFLREWNYEYDAKNPDKVVIGTEDNGLFNILKILCYSNNTIQVKPIEAELAKLALNSLAVIKVVFAEELADLSNVLNCEYKNIYKIFSLDQNVNIRHLESYKDGYKGADGKCLPKDSEFLVKTGELYNSRMSLLETAVTINKFMLRVR